METRWNDPALPRELAEPIAAPPPPAPSVLDGDDIARCAGRFDNTGRFGLPQNMVVDPYPTREEMEERFQRRQREVYEEARRRMQGLHPQVPASAQQGRANYVLQPGQYAVRLLGHGGDTDLGIVVNIQEETTFADGTVEYVLRVRGTR